jgi:tetratricopeptide (TPR) repeat protein
MSRIRRSLIASLLLGTGSLFADRLELHSGEIIEGKILRVSPTEVVIQTQFSETITEDRPIPRSEIKNMERMPEDQRAWQEVQAEVSLPESALDASVYDAGIVRLKEFIEKFSYSAKVEEARSLLRTFEKERAQVAAGTPKIDGKFATAEEMQDGSGDLDARREVLAIQRRAETGDLLGALNRFLVYEKNHSTHQTYPEAIINARNHLRSLQGLLEHEQRNFPILEEQRKNNLELANASTRSSLEAARVRELENLQTSVERARTQGDVFLPYASFAPDSMRALQATVEKELNRLGDLDPTAMLASLQKTRQAETFLETGDLTAAQETVQRALTRWPENAQAKALDARITSALEARQAAAERQQQAVEEGFTSSQEN